VGARPVSDAGGGRAHAVNLNTVHYLPQLVAGKREV
jgi:hypothetical protein